MADHNHHHHQRPNRISLPTRATTPIFPTTPKPLYPPTTPTPTPSKHRRNSSKKSNLSSLFFLLFSLRSLYSLLPFIKSSSSSFSLFPFSFLVSLLSLLLSLLFSFNSIFSLPKINQSQLKFLFAKSLVLAVVFLLRFQALKYCGTAALILAEMSGNVVARFVAEGKDRNFGARIAVGTGNIRGFIALLCGLFFLSISWDRIECFPFSSVNVEKFGFSFMPNDNCVRIWPMLLPFVCGFLGCYERVAMNWGNVREMSRKQLRLVSLFFTTIVLFVPAVISMFVFEVEGDSILVGDLGWPLANTVVFGVLLSENYTDDKVVSSKDFQGEFVVTFICTIVLELFYYSELSLFGLLICGLLVGIAVKELNPLYSRYTELGLESSESLTTSIMKPVRHIWSERKSPLAIGLYASYISRLPANSQFNYGRGRFEILSGYVNAVFLVLVGALIVVESCERILDPQEISTSSLLTVSIGGLLVNVVGLIFFHEEHHHAHGGSASCSHSHSHSHSSHHHHSHDHVENDQSVHRIVEESVLHESNKKSGHNSKCGDNHFHNDCDHQPNGSAKHHDDHNHRHNGHNHQHEHHDDHNHHHNDHSHQHEHHGDHEHHDHEHHQHEHADHEHHQHEHHDHHHQHEHHDHHDANVHRSVSLNNSIQNGALGDSQKFGLEYIEPKKETAQKHQHRHIDHNMEGIFLHVLADTLGSVGVVISTLLIKYKGWLASDPICSIFISVLIVSSVIPLLRNSAEILLQRIPKVHEHDLKEAIRDVVKMKGVRGIQRLHIWSFTNDDVVGTVHLHVSTETDKTSAKTQVLMYDSG
ncbi:zinc transporter 5 [Heracleum sosnowskyi]|uniref:Zinc transporter 5 n=1 Tax=Heracleum sosnowskyi TaxID=360622 RepID=A0AAD8IDX9_9APIA|nr:zinc transporter 5 [Heracleum sosnowskyi]